MIVTVICSESLEYFGGFNIKQFDFSELEEVSEYIKGLKNQVETDGDLDYPTIYRWDYILVMFDHQIVLDCGSSRRFSNLVNPKRFLKKVEDLNRMINEGVCRSGR